MEDGLVPRDLFLGSQITRLNPCCSGRWSRTAVQSVIVKFLKEGLNPCCSGRWSRTGVTVLIMSFLYVLILVVVEDGLVQLYYELIYFKEKRLNPCCSGRWSRTMTECDERRGKTPVLILVVVEDGLVQMVGRVQC